jgi:hypothetical protein
LINKVCRSVALFHHSVKQRLLIGTASLCALQDIV